MTTTIAILGSCVSEDWYHFQGVHNRLDVRLVPRYQLSSLISIMSKPLAAAIEPDPLLKPAELVALRIDLDKSFLSRLSDAKPDILILELLGDSRRSLGVISVGDSWITNSYILQRCNLPSEVRDGKYLNVMDDPDAYIALFRQSARAFGEFMKRELPRCRMVINQARWAEYFLDAKGELISYPPLKQLSSFQANARLELLENTLAKEIACDRIAVDDIPAFADEQHIWGPSPDHFTRVFYTSFADKLRDYIAHLASGGVTGIDWQGADGARAATGHALISENDG